MARFLAALLCLVLGSSAVAQSVEVEDDSAAANPPQPTQNKAQSYFGARKKNTRAPASEPGATPRYLAIAIGTFFTDQSYKWGDGTQKNTGKINGGVTYRLGEWVNSMDLSVRIEYTSYSFDNGNAQKLSVGPLLTFPDANSRFPLYFGGGIGAGLFIQQLHDRSPVALDWQVVAGVRVMNVFEKAGLMVETGLKNHVLLFTPGQFNGVFINIGTVFAF